MSRPAAVGLAVAVTLLVSAGVGGFLWQANADEPSGASWLFSHTSREALLEASPSGEHRLTMSGIDANVIAFTDRPDRRAAMLTPTELAAEWPAMFSDAAPNAVLVGHLPTGEANSLVVELFDPVVDGERMTYSVVILADEFSSDATSRQFASVSLFIDSVSEDPRNDEPRDDSDLDEPSREEDDVWKKWEAVHYSR